MGGGDVEWVVDGGRKRGKGRREDGEAGDVYPGKYPSTVFQSLRPEGSQGSLKLVAWRTSHPR